MTQQRDRDRPGGGRGPRKPRRGKRGLSKDQLISAVRQVASLVHNFGTSYSSMDIGFGN